MARPRPNLYADRAREDAPGLDRQLATPRGFPIITLRFEIVDSELDLKFFKKVLVTEDQFELSRFDLVDYLAADLKTLVVGKWRNEKQPPPAVDKS